MNGYPRLYIGRAAKELKKRVSFQIYQVDNSSIAEFTIYYSTIQNLKTPLVIEDISYLSEEKQAILLKFVEDSSLKIILLATEDNILPTILSRMSLVYKIKEDVSSMFLPALEAQEELDKIDVDTHYLNYVRKEMEKSPESYYYDSLLKNKPNKNKLLQLII